MLITKTTPAGIDIPLQSFQTDVHDALLLKWGINTALYKAYGRCYRNRDSKNGFIAENYEGNKEYKEVYWNDTLAAISFFGTGKEIGNGSLQATSVHMVFFVDLKKVFPSVTHRADEEARRDVYDIVKNGSYGLTFTGFEIGLENCLREYPGSRRDDRLKYVDMNPVHCFRLNFDIEYYILKQCIN